MELVDISDLVDLLNAIASTAIEHSSRQTRLTDVNIHDFLFVINQTVAALDECRNCSKVIKLNPYYDCISRQDAIDKMWEELDEDTAYHVRDILEMQPNIRPKLQTNETVEVLEKIRTKIEQLDYVSIEDGSDGYDHYVDNYDVFQIIDKCKAEGESKG